MARNTWITGFGAAAFGALALAGTSAHAGSASIHLNIGTPGYYVQPGYVYTQPSYVYTEPAHVYTQPAYVYTQPSYVYTRPGRVYYGHPHGHPHGHHHGRWHRWRDRDGDGIHNRYDRDRDNDGVPNHRDRRPNNPYRY